MVGYTLTVKFSRKKYSSLLRLSLTLRRFESSLLSTFQFIRVKKYPINPNFIFVQACRAFESSPGQETQRGRFSVSAWKIFCLLPSKRLALAPPNFFGAMGPRSDPHFARAREPNSLLHLLVRPLKLSYTLIYCYSYQQSRNCCIKKYTSVSNSKITSY